MRGLSRIVLAAAAFVSSSYAAAAWGVKGHQIVAQIAELNLSSNAREAVDVLLASEGKRSLADIANWADGVRHLKVPLQPSHSLRLQNGRAPFEKDRDCPRDNCILSAIAADVETLTNPSARIEAKTMALKYLVHFVGDIHMPLHTTEAGRGLEVQFRSRRVTLHKVWDTYIVSAIPGDAYEIAHKIGNLKSYGPLPQSSPLDWALEGRDIVQNEILVGQFVSINKGIVVLSNSYLKENAPIAQERLRLAGFRLAQLLNRMYLNPHAGEASGDDSDDDGEP